MSRNSMLAVFLLTSFAAGPLLGQGLNGREGDETKDILDGYTHSGSLRETLEKVSAVKKKDMNALLVDEDQTVRLFAAWQVAQKRNKTPSLGDSQWFLGFLSGAMGMESPRRWEYFLSYEFFRGHSDLQEQAMRSFLPGADFVRVTDGMTAYLPRRRVKCDAGYRLRKGVTLTISDKKVVIIEEKNKLEVALSVFESLKKGLEGHDTVEVMFKGNVAIIAIYDQFGSAFPLACVDFQSGELLWRTTVWAGGTDGGPWFGPAGHDVFLVSNRKSVGVFGETPGCYAEQFDLKTGKPLSRFSARLWGAR
jgi:hypothetical protein